MPSAYDVSHWKEIPDFKAVEPRPAIFITKATEAYPDSGYNHTDEKFVRFAEGMMEISCIRGFYHFFRKAFDARRQADHFLNVISRIDILSTDLLILDVEEGGETASQLWTWHEQVKRSYPNTRMIYSRKNILDPIQMTTGEKEYFKGIWTWPAGYPFFPDLYSSVPSGYVPDQGKFGPVALWQYSAHGKVTGIIGDVDLNWINPAFLEHIGTPEIGELIMANYQGTCKTSAKVWRTIGGERVYPDVAVGQTIAADAKQGEYLHLTSPTAGWSKALWFNYEPATELPPPPPPPAPEEEYILHVKNGVTRKFVPE
jgi:lysozyme